MDFDALRKEIVAAIKGKKKVNEKKGIQLLKSAAWDLVNELVAMSCSTTMKADHMEFSDAPVNDVELKMNDRFLPYGSCPIEREIHYKRARAALLLQCSCYVKKLIREPKEVD